MKLLDKIFDPLGKWYINNKYRKEYEKKKFQYINERPIEYRFVFEAITKIYPKKILDVGTGITSLPHLMSICGISVTAIDNISDYWSKGIFNRHYYVFNDDITKSKLDMKFDLITCISVLEHIKDFEAAVKNMVNLLKKKGYLILTFPYNEEKYISNVYKLSKAGYGKEFPYICQIFSRNELNHWLDAYNLEMQKQEYWQVFNGELWTFGERVYPPRQVTKEERNQLSCILLQKI